MAVPDKTGEIHDHKHHHINKMISFGQITFVTEIIHKRIKSLPTNEEGRERDVDSRHKGKASRTISSSSSSDDGDNRGSRQGGGTSGGNRGVGGTSEGTGGDGSIGGSYVSQVGPDMSWAQGGKNYYATQDTDHGYRPGIWKQ
eukprot:XP_019078093.1 PREDICTED: glycine-rich RNA-binding protein GRP2A-like [Vitis vinifera]